MRGYFFNAEPTTDYEQHPTGYDRAYDALDYNLVMGTFFHNGIFGNINPDACKAVVDGLTVTFTPGVALINGGQAHFDQEDSVVLTEGDGYYSIMCRKNTASEVRAFELVALKGDDYPVPVREGDIYDLCLAHVLVSDGVAAVADTRGDPDICGFAAVAGQPPYQPSTGVPALLWDYTLFPQQLTEEQRQIVETTPSLMEMFEACRPKTDWFTKEESLSAATAELIGLAPDAALDEALDKLSYPYKHLWVKHPGIIKISDVFTDTRINLTVSGRNSQSELVDIFHYALTCDPLTGELVLGDPKTLQLSYNTYQDVVALRGRFVQSTITTTNPEALRDAYYYIPDDASYNRATGGSGWVYVWIQAQMIEFETTEPFNPTLAFSTDPEAFPQEGVQDGDRYKYFGTLYDGTEQFIKRNELNCIDGIYTPSASMYQRINLGFEPSLVLLMVPNSVVNSTILSQTRKKLGRWRITPFGFEQIGSLSNHAVHYIAWR